MQITLTDIVKTFGEKTAVDGVSFEAHNGHVFGLLGRNGAGKTTTMRMIMDVFKPDSGKITVDGKPVDRKKIRFGYLPEERGLYPKMVIKTQLLYLAELNGISRSKALVEIDKWLEKLEMSQYLDKKLDTLSKGNQQKIQLASVMICNPDIIILDEPFSGLDPVNAEALKNVIFEKVGEGKIVIFSSHQMSNIEEICDEILILDNGKVALSGKLNEIKNNYPKKHINISGNDVQKVKENLERASGMYEKIETDEYNLDVHLKEESDRNKLLKMISDNKYDIDTFRVVKPSLHEIFIGATKEVG